MRETLRLMFNKRTYANSHIDRAFKHQGECQRRNQQRTTYVPPLSAHLFCQSASQPFPHHISKTMLPNVCGCMPDSPLDSSVCEFFRGKRGPICPEDPGRREADLVMQLLGLLCLEICDICVFMFCFCVLPSAARGPVPPRQDASEPQRLRRTQPLRGRLRGRHAAMRRLSGLAPPKRRKNQEQQFLGVAAQAPRCSACLSASSCHSIKN